MILHDWNDDGMRPHPRQPCGGRWAGRARVFTADYVVPGPEEPHFSKLFDIHMICWGTGRERDSSGVCRAYGGGRLALRRDASGT